MMRADLRACGRLIVGVLTLVACVAFGSASALTPVVMLDAQWKPQRARLVSLGDGVIQHYDGGRVLRERLTRDVVRLRFESPTHSGAEANRVSRGVRDAQRVLVLTDGQRFLGEADGQEDRGQTLAWRHDVLGRIEIPLERIARIETTAGQGSRDAAHDLSHEAPDTDTVTFANGDTLSGFVGGVTDLGLSLETSDGAVIELEWDGLVGLELANPAADELVSVDVVRLVDGTRFHAHRLEIQDEELQGRALWVQESRPMASIPFSQVVSIDFAASGLRVASLTELPATVLDAGDVFGLSYPPRVDGSGVLLHAPVVVEFSLPVSGKHVAGVAALVLPTRLHPALRMLTGATLHLEAGRPGPEFVLGPNSPVSFSVPIDGDRFTLRLDAGQRGPVLDRVRISDAVVLLSVPPEPVSAADP